MDETPTGTFLCRSGMHFHKVVLVSLKDLPQVPELQAPQLVPARKKVLKAFPLTYRHTISTEEGSTQMCGTVLPLM